MMTYEIKKTDNNERLIEVCALVGLKLETVVEFPLSAEDTEYLGDEVPGMKNYTWRENIESLENYLNDCGVDEETAEHIIDELDSWIAEISLPENESIARDIAWWDERIAGYTDTMERHQSLILESYKEIEEIRKRIRVERQRVKEIQMEIAKFNLKIRDLEERLKGREV